MATPRQDRRLDKKACCQLWQYADEGTVKSLMASAETGNRLTRTATRADYEYRFSQSATNLVAAIVNRNGRETRGAGQAMATPRQDRRLDKKACCQLWQYADEGTVKSVVASAETGNRFTRTATRADYEYRFSQSATNLVAAIVNRNGRETRGAGQTMANPRQDRRLDKKACCQLWQYADEGTVKSLMASAETGNRLTRTATRADYEYRFSQSATNLVAAIVNRNGRETRGAGQAMANPRQDRRLDKKACCQLWQYADEMVLCCAR